jgi:flavorubredoxin
MKRIIAEGIFLLGAVDWNRRLFDALIPLPDGTSYNAYLIKGSKATALIDTADPTKKEILLAQLNDVEKIDYLVANHAEQDHSGSLPWVAARYPQARIICTPKCKDMLVDLLRIPEERFQTVEDGQAISLGNKTLEFIHTPWVHWPETMCTYLKEAQILFSCDFFGSHYATTELFAKDRAAVYEAAKRYYAEIMMPFRVVIRKNLEKVMAREPKMIAPSHGPIYDEPAFIMDAYAAWISEHVQNEVVIPYISMHGSTEAMVQHLTGALAERGVKVYLFDLAVTDLGKLAIALVDAATIVIGTPTVHVGPHPAVFYAAHLANALRPKLRFASVIGSYGWSSKAIEHITELIPNLKVEILAPVLCRGCPRENDFQALDVLADTIARKHQNLD